MGGSAGGEGVVGVGGGCGGRVPGWGTAASSGNTAVGGGAAIGVDGAAAVGVGIDGSRAVAASVVGGRATTAVGTDGVLAPHGGSGC